MTRMVMALTLLSSIVALSQEPEKIDSKKLEGVWVVQSAGILAKELSKARFEFKDGKLTVTPANGKAQTSEFTVGKTVGSFREIDFTWNETKVKGIYLHPVSAGLSILFDTTGKTRPVSLKVGQNLALLTMMRPREKAPFVVKRKQLTEEQKKWARGVAEDVINAGLRNKYALAAPLVTEDNRKTVGDLFKAGGTDIESAYSSFTIDSETGSPDGDEVVCKGKLKGENGEGDFTIRVTQDTDGKWRVRYFLWSPPKKK